MLHQFFAVFVAMMFSFCHHNGGMQPLGTAISSTQTVSGEGTAPMLLFPDRHELARSASIASYAESGCSSCQMTTVSYTSR